MELSQVPLKGAPKELTFGFSTKVCSHLSKLSYGCKDCVRVIVPFFDLTHDRITSDLEF